MFSTTSEYVWQKIQPRPRDAHKGTFGSVLVVAGSAVLEDGEVICPNCGEKLEFDMSSLEEDNGEDNGNQE